MFKKQLLKTTFQLGLENSANMTEQWLLLYRLPRPVKRQGKVVPMPVKSWLLKRQLLEQFLGLDKLVLWLRKLDSQHQAWRRRDVLPA